MVQLAQGILRLVTEMEENLKTIGENKRVLENVLQNQLDEMRRKKRYYKGMAKKFK